MNNLKTFGTHMYIYMYFLVREKKLAAQFSGLIKEKCELLEKLCLAEKEVRQF